MEKICELCGKIYNAKRSEQKYCTVVCQHNSYKKLKVDRVERKCLYCDIIFYKIPSKSNSKYCTRKCKDKHQKQLYLGEKNPSYNRIVSDNERQIRSLIFKKKWEEDDSFRKKIRHGQESFFKLNGFWPGTDEKSNEKRRKTMIDKYGISHNWNGKYGERKCDKTTLEIYGKTPVDFLSEYSFYFGKKTNIELIFEDLLNELNIPNQPKYRVYNKNKKEFHYREYDFLIIGTNILIETDGDYWHGNTNKFKELTELQKQTIKNDEIKQKFAENQGFKVIRFWEEEILSNKEKIKETLLKLWERKSN